MRTRRFAWLGVAALAACAVAYVVSCVDNSSAVDPCPKYCEDIQATCTGSDQQYPDNATCLRFCNAINSMADSGTTNTIDCRAKNVSSAKDEPDPTAKHAECLGGGVAAGQGNCGASNCADFCALDLALCTGNDVVYPSQAACETACAAWGTSFDGQLIGSTGDTLQCRTYHLELSQTGQAADLDTHCPHTGVTSARCNDGGTTPPADGGTDAASD